MNKKAFIVPLVLAILAILIIIAIGFVRLTGNELRGVTQKRNSLKAFFLAEAGVEKALYKLPKDPGYTGETGVPLGEGVFDVTVGPVFNNKREITGTGYIPNKTSPSAIREVRIAAERPACPAGDSVQAALMSLTDGKEVSLKGTADVDGGIAAGIKIPNKDMVDIQGAAQVNGNPDILESPPPSFQQIFGLTETQMKSIANVYAKQKNPNDPDPANGLTWIEGDAKFSAKGWRGKGAIIVTGNLELTGGIFEGIIYVMGSIETQGGNAIVKGALIGKGDIRFVGTSSVIYDKIAIENIANYYPYETKIWEEVK